MKTRIDAAGRIVIPRALRDQVGITPGPIDIHVVGSSIVIEPLAAEGFIERDGMLIIPAAGEPITDQDVRDLLESGRR